MYAKLFDIPEDNNLNLTKLVKKVNTDGETPKQTKELEDKAKALGLKRGDMYPVRLVFLPTGVAKEITFEKAVFSSSHAVINSGNIRIKLDASGRKYREIHSNLSYYSSDYGDDSRKSPQDFKDGANEFKEFLKKYDKKQKGGLERPEVGWKSETKVALKDLDPALIQVIPSKMSDRYVYDLRPTSVEFPKVGGLKILTGSGNPMKGLDVTIKTFLDMYESSGGRNADVVKFFYNPTLIFDSTIRKEVFGADKIPVLKWIYCTGKQLSDGSYNKESMGYQNPEIEIVDYPEELNSVKDFIYSNPLSSMRHFHPFLEQVYFLSKSVSTTSGRTFKDEYGRFFHVHDISKYESMEGSIDYMLDIPDDQLPSKKVQDSTTDMFSEEDSF